VASAANNDAAITARAYRYDISLGVLLP